jgi:hypothetical protein
MAGGDLCIKMLVCRHVEVDSRAALRIEVTSTMIGKQHAV